MKFDDLYVQLLTEIIVTSLSQNDLLKEASTIEAAMEKLRKIVKSLNLGSDVFTKIAKIINLSSGTQMTTATDFLTSIGFTNQEARTITNEIKSDFSLDDINAFADYVQTRPVTLDSLVNKVSDMEKVLAGQNLSKDFARWIMNLKRDTSPPAGRGEAALSIILNGGKVPATGDLQVDNYKMEVKGKNGRLIGQSGYGDGKAPALYMARELKKLTDQHGIDSPPSDPLEYNFTRKGESAFSTTGRHLVKHTDVSPDDLLQILTDALGLLYTDPGASKELKKVLKGTIKKDGSVDTPKFHNALLQYSFDYYHRAENFDYFVMVKDNKFLIIDPKDFAKNMKHFNYSIPSFGEKAGTQGKAYGLTLK